MSIKSSKTVKLLCILFFCTCASLQAQRGSREKILVAYFSHTGNTRAVAENIQKATGADIFEILTLKSYPTEYQAVVDQAVVDQAEKEIRDNVHPELKTRVKNLKDYDVIFIGSPCWWATIAPPVASFLASYDFSGKTIVPFMTHEGSRMGHSEADIRKLCPKATVVQGLPVRGSSATSSGEVVRTWVEKLKLATEQSARTERQH